MGRFSLLCRRLALEAGPTQRIRSRTALLAGFFALSALSRFCYGDTPPVKPVDSLRQVAAAIASDDFLKGQWPERSAAHQEALSRFLSQLEELKKELHHQELLWMASIVLDRASKLEQLDKSKETLLTARRLAYEASTMSGEAKLRETAFHRYVSAVVETQPVPKAAWILLEEGVRCKKEGHRKEAEDLFKRIIEFAPADDPSCRQAYGEVAVLLSEQGKTGEVLMAYYKAKKEGRLGEIPFDAKLWLAGEIQNEGLEHIYLLKLAQKENPEKAELCQYLIVNYLHTSRYRDELKKELKLLKEKYPNTYKGFGDKVEANVAAEEGRSSNPKPREKEGE